LIFNSKENVCLKKKKPKGRTPRKVRRPFDDVITQKRNQIKWLTSMLTKKSATNPIEDTAEQIAQAAKDLKRWKGYQRQLEIAGELAALRDGNTIRIPPRQAPPPRRA